MAARKRHKCMHQRVDRFSHSRWRMYILSGAALGLCLLSMFMFGVDAVPIVVATIGGVFTLATGQTVISNYAESKNPEYYFALPDEEPHRTGGN